MQSVRALVAEGGDDLRAQLVDVERRGVEHEVSVATQVTQQLSFVRDAVGQGPVGLQRMRTAYAVEPPDERVVGRLQEQHPNPQARAVEVGQRGSDVGGEATTAHVDDDSDLVDGALGAGGQLDHRGEQRRLQVVDDEPVEVLQALRGGAATGTGQASDHDQVEGGRHGCGGRNSHGLASKPPTTTASVSGPASMISPVAGSTAAGAVAPARAATTASAVRRPTPGTEAISSTDAVRSRFTEPNARSRALRRSSPSPGTPSRTLTVSAFDRFCRW